MEINKAGRTVLTGFEKDGTQYTASFDTSIEPMEIDCKNNELPIKLELKPLELELKVRPIKIKKMLKDYKYNKMLKKVDKIIKTISKLGYSATIQIDQAKKEMEK